MMNTTMKIVSIGALTAAAALGMTGCGLGSASYTVPTEVKGAAFHGTIFGGQQPVVGSTIKLYATGSTGYGSAFPYTTGTGNLLTVAITSGAGGSFDVTGDYTCPSASTPVYLVATGGNSGFTNNPNLALMAALGACGNLGASTFVNINEVTTIASVYALSPFMTGIANIGTSSNNVTGLTNAMADVNVLANTATGNAGGTTVVAGATLPIATINTLANILAACVNSSGGAAGTNTACGTLFTATTAGSAPTDTITAAMNIAQNPGRNVGTLYALPPASSPFQPMLSAQPSDFTLAVTFGGGVVNTPSALASDSAGNVWITNSGTATVSKLTHTGVPATGSPYTSTFSTPSSIAIATDGGAWITNQGNNTVTRLSSAGATVQTISGGGLNAPRSIAFDSNGTAWVVNAGNASVTSITSAGGSPTNFTPAGASAPIAVGVNPH